VAACDVFGSVIVSVSAGVEDGGESLEGGVGDLGEDAGLAAADRSALPIAGDDTEAKAAVAAFLDSIGYDAVDAGSLAESWRQDSGSPAYGAPYGPYSDKTGTPADAAKIRAALAAARR
jgi:8-hydroxy-5-deazaflavin:NADPH oxidoreductase